MMPPFIPPDGGVPPMLPWVITFNLLITSGAMTLAWRLWRLRKQLARVTESLDTAQQDLQTTLQQATLDLEASQAGLVTLAASCDRTQAQLRQVRQGLALMQWLLRWQRPRPQSRLRTQSQRHPQSQLRTQSQRHPQSQLHPRFQHQPDKSRPNKS
jgi:hypothetical protein